MYKCVHSKVTYSLRAHQLTAQKVGKGGNAIFINQVIIHHTKCNLKNVEYVHSKVTYSLRMHQFTVQVGKGGKVIVINQVTFITQSSILRYAQAKATLPPEYDIKCVPGHSTAS